MANQPFTREEVSQARHLLTNAADYIGSEDWPSLQETAWLIVQTAHRHARAAKPQLTVVQNREPGDAA